MSSKVSFFVVLTVSALSTSCGTERLAPQVLEAPIALFDRFQDSEWSEPVHLDAPVNSPWRELRAHLSPDELSLYIASDRPGGQGAFDIWVSRRACRDCAW